MAKKVESGSYDIRSALPPGQKRELRNAIRTQSEQLLILRKVRYLDGGDDNISILTEGFDLPDRSGPTSPEPIAADGGVSGYLDADVDNEASEPTDGPDPADLVGSTPLKPILMEEVATSKNAGPTRALIHYKKDGFVAMANAGRYFLTFVPTRVIYQFHFMNSSNMTSAVPTHLQNGNAIDSTLEQKDGPQATINEGRLFCYCGSCCGYTPVSFSVFQQHASCTEENVLSYLFSENKTSIHDVLEALYVFEMAIEHMVGGIPSMKAYKCHICKGLFQTPVKSNFRLFCSSRLDPQRAREAPPTITNISNIESRSLLPNLKILLVGLNGENHTITFALGMVSHCIHQLAVCLAKKPDLSDSEKDSLRRACADPNDDEGEILHFGLSP